MPSPFPGMDPYLENPVLWPDVHHELISKIRSALNEKLRPKYVARVELRVYLSDEDEQQREHFIPDLRLEESRNSGKQVAFDTALMEASPSVLVQTKFEEEIEEPRVEILDVADKRLVTVIELLSPANKRPGRGREEFLNKRREIMDSPSHWVEIDLLRGGQPVLSRNRLPACDYAVHVSRHHQRPRGQVWPVRLFDPLPNINIPLLREDKEITLSLSDIMNASYEAAAYDLTVDYKSEPIPPLSSEQAVWADKLLKEKGLR